MSDHSALTDSIGWLFPWVGTGGLTAIVIAWLGSRRPAATEPKQSQLHAAAGIGALLADQYAIDRLTNEMRRLADANEQLARGVNRYCDLMDITQALGRLHRDRDTRERDRPRSEDQD